MTAPHTQPRIIPYLFSLVNTSLLMLRRMLGRLSVIIDGEQAVILEVPDGLVVGQQLRLALVHQLHAAGPVER